MDLINKKTKSIRINEGRAMTRTWIKVGKNSVYFTANVTRILGLSVGLYVHFLNEDADWRFFINDDTDGFKLTPVVAKGGYQINSTGLVSMILKSTGFKDEKRFSLEVTPQFHDNCPIYKMSLENVPTSTI